MTSRKWTNLLCVCGIALLACLTPQRVLAVDTGIPLCEGLLITTAIQQTDGDYESIKRIEAVSDTSVRLRYSSERMVQDWLSSDPPTLGRSTVYRTIDRTDLENASLYLQQFSELIPEHIPGTTAIGVSRQVLESLNSTGSAELGIFIAFSGNASIDRNEHPNVYDNQMVTTVHKTGNLDVSVIVNDVAADLPAIRAEGDFFGEKTEFLILDDPHNPIVLKYRFGIDSISAVTPEETRLYGIPYSPARDRDVLQVIKISSGCGGHTPEMGGGSADDSGTGSASDDASASTIEQALAENRKVDIYSIFFVFDSDEIRSESEPALAEIAGVLQRNPGWQLSVEGHTDSIASDAYNSDLSKRRAAAV